MFTNYLVHKIDFQQNTANKIHQTHVKTFNQSQMGMTIRFSMISIWRERKYAFFIGDILLVSILIISLFSLDCSISSFFLLSRLATCSLTSLDCSISSLFFLLIRLVSFSISSLDYSNTSLSFVRRIYSCRSSIL